MKSPVPEYRVLSLASSLVFLIVFVSCFFVAINESISPFAGFFAEHLFLLLLSPALLPSLALVRLAYLRIVRKYPVPFFNGWFMHLVILLPYALAYYFRTATC